MTHDWFIVHDGKEQGPYSAGQLGALAQHGRIKRDTLVRRGDESMPKPAQDIKGLAPCFAASRLTVSSVAQARVIEPMDRGLRRHGEKVSCLAFSHDGKVLASGGFDKLVRLWHIPYQKSLPDGIGWLSYHDAPISLLSFSPDDRLLAASSGDGTVTLWDMTKRLDKPRPVATLRGHKGAVNAVAFLSDGKLVVTGGNDRTLRLWDAATGQEIKEKGFMAMSPYLHLCVVPTVQKAHVMSVIRGWEVDFVDMENSQVLYRQKTEGRVCHVAVSSEGYHVAAAGPSMVYLWYFNEQFKFEGGWWAAHVGQVWSVAFSPNCKSLASAGSDETARIWDVRTKQQLATCVGHVGAVHDVAFSPDGKLLATAGKDWIVHLWDLTVLPAECLK